MFIIDDCSAESEINKKRDALSELAFSSRHRNHYLWVLTQKFNTISKDKLNGNLNENGQKSDEVFLTQNPVKILSRSAIALLILYKRSR